MAQTVCLVMTEAFILLLAVVCSDSQTSTSPTGGCGFFNQTSLLTLRAFTWNMQNSKEVTFRTCAPNGTFLQQVAANSTTLGARSFKLFLQNGTAVFEWRVSPGSISTGSSSDVLQSVSVGQNLSSNQQYTLKLKKYLGVIYLNVTSVQGSTIYSAVVANSTNNVELLDATISGQDAFVGRDFAGCLCSGPGVNFTWNSVSSGVVWNSCPLDGMTRCSISDGDDCFSLPCQNGGTCVDLFRNYTCNCPLNFNGTNCENDLARLYGCQISPCQNNASCQSLNVTSGTLPYRCFCLPGFTGVNCETELDQCKKQPCQNGVCKNGPNTYFCNCTGTGFQGVNCSVDINECLSSPCLNGSCYNTPGGYSCECPAGFDGPHCQNINECESSPCRNGGNCRDGINNYTCSCPLGFTGTNCQQNIDDCVNVTCPGSNSICFDGIASFHCGCKPGFTGMPGNCTDINECLPAPCRNNATCRDLNNSYECVCAPGFTGVNCEINIDDCASNPCLNNGTCFDGINKFTCQCVLGFTNTTCNVNINDCIPNKCKNGATCVDKINSFNCICTIGWTGGFCQANIDECLSMPCQNGGICQDFVGYYNCTCPTGFRGTNCETNINDCLASNCLNGGTCVDGINDYMCNCSSIWMGKNCSEVYDACSFVPCKNGATCQTTKPSHSYNCTCLSGFTGRNCETNIDNCPNHTCASFQICQDGVNNYTCVCPLGFQGERCQIDINECFSNPCQNDATCHDNIGNYSCSCQQGPSNPSHYRTGYEGRDCELDINECLYRPNICQNSGTCENLDGSYSCRCLGQTSTGDLITGQNCEIVTSYCIASGSPCKNGATCESVIGNYICHCVPGYTDKNCSTNIDECQSSPCRYNGTCNDGINNFTCQCIPGITGFTCDINIDDCVNNPCKPGSCYDQINSFLCDCFDTGFSGDRCQINIDDCLHNDCQYNSTCVDGIKGYTCQCLEAYTGNRCNVDINECASNPCLYNGSCLENSNRTLYDIGHKGFINFSYATAAGYRCECIPGITGSNCEINIDDCANITCHNGGTCNDFINGYKCSCAPGYKGPSCETNINECEEYNPCENGSNCTDRIADYFCTCQPFSNSSRNYAGKNCSVYLQGCDHGNNCRHGWCVPVLLNETTNQHDYICNCEPGFTGHFCNQSTTVTFNASGGQLTHNMSLSSYTAALSFRFRTTLREAILVMFTFTDEIFASLEIHNARIWLVYSNASLQTNQELYTQKDLDVEEDWHNVNIIFSNTFSVALVSNSCGKEHCIQELDYTSGHQDSLTSRIRFGYIDSSLRSRTLSKRSYVGCMEDIIFNNSYLFVVQPNITQANMFPGCPRTDQCGLYTCSRHGVCVDLWDTFFCECQRPYWDTHCNKEYTVATFSRNGAKSYAVFNLPNNVSFSTNINISLFLLTRQDNSMILYLGNNETNSGSTTFITLELFNGQLRTHLKFCNFANYFNTSANSFVKGVFNFVQLQIMPRSVILRVNGTIRLNETFNETFGGGFCPFLAPTIYFGGKFPNSSLVRRRRQTDTLNYSSEQFVGVIQDIELQGYKLDFYNRNATNELTVLLSDSQNLTVGALSTENVCSTGLPCENGGTCMNKFYNDFQCLCPSGFLGKNCSQPDFCKNSSCPPWAHCQSLQLGFECISNATFNGIDSVATYSPVLPYGLPSQQISFKVRTRSFYGAIFETRAIQKNYFIKLRVSEATLEVNYLLKEGRSESLRLSSHFHINDGQWYSIDFKMGDNQMYFSVSQNETILAESLKTTLSGSVVDFSSLILNGTVYVGNVAGQKEQSFSGCLQEVRIGGILLPFIYDSQMVNNSAPEKFAVSRLVSVSDDCSTRDSCFASLCKNGATCLNVWKDFKCICPLGYTGHYCEQTINDCQGNDCKNGALCIDAVGSYTCKCRAGYTGVKCESAVDVCMNSSCSNGSQCVKNDSIMRKYYCNCSDLEFTGDFCNISIHQNCSSNPCQNGGTCNSPSQNLTFSCNCSAGFTGPVCESAIDYCINSTCGNGTCSSQSKWQNYTCTCLQGYTGTKCETGINDCTNTSCQNGGTCFDLINDTSCSCTDGWTGIRCETNVNECNQSVCQHGTCTDRNGSFSCNCTESGYSGTNCQTEINECKLGFCKNGNCSDIEGSFICECFLGFGGSDCSVANCSHNQCMNGGICNITKGGSSWGCTCQEYYGGPTCNISGPCVFKPCNMSNAKKCHQNAILNTTDVQNNYTCECMEGWSGQNCTIDIDECLSRPCNNSATCHNTQGSFNCICMAGYTGTKCETDIDDCSSHPCEHNGTCIDKVNNYTCNCNNTGYQGNICEEDINECDIQSCHNGSCINNNGSFDCVCGDQYLGTRCEFENPCFYYVCQNGGVCNYTFQTSQYNASCLCSSGYGGERCEQSHFTGDDNINIGVIIGPIIAILLLIIIIGVIIFLMAARKKRATRGAYSPSQQETSGSRVELGNVLKKPPEERLI